ncbi:tetratricopeptide repeat protein [Arcticibacterium luteifluviistationis]|uniref:HTH luxR-type domain-containing protein n=1 Tax=Arcticibacterium luteifluviistationis TaxID=1784714 RepID=A0A2Z4G6L0_9BACT|nr:hypothetical protein [Arcticibacterium luteifluviistationis]AWV96764.1 hypothetical protein DJ013_00575 [Arcticibacterium luteifluviistationis]
MKWKLVLVLCSLFLVESKAQETNQKLNETLKLRYTDYNTCLDLLEDFKEQFLFEGDTVQAIFTLRKIADINGHHAKYKASYDNLWQALSLASKADKQDIVASIYVDIGRYYGFYKREEKAFQLVKRGLEIKKQLVSIDKLPESSLVEAYYALCVLNREFLNYKQAQIYLDSCYTYIHESENQLWNKAGLDFEKAVIFTNTGKVNAAIQIFESIKATFEEKQPEYNVLVETYQGLANMEYGQLDHAERNFRKALEISETYDSHRDFANLIHEYLSNIYFKKGNLPLAYQELKIVKERDKLFFDSRSENNSALLEIQDRFREESQRTADLLREQKLQELEDAEQIYFLQRSLLVIALLFVGLTSFLYFKYLRNKYKAEKELAFKNKELEIQKANELIEVKNKEMAVSALKLIEKEEALSDFKTNLEKADWNLDTNKLKKAVKSLSTGHDQNWKEFETRFVAVNNKFYQNLHAKFPSLTATEDKLCALVKLNFNSKDMSKLLGISIESVHTSRYRLRKKLELERDDNLTDFINKF